MKRLFSITGNTFGSQLYLACGNALSQLDRQAVRSIYILHQKMRQIQIILFTEMFAATGWRVGWLIGPADIIRPTLAATTRIVFATNSPLQEAAAAGLEEANKRQFFEKNLIDYAERREILVKTFDKLGLQYTIPDGTYFMLLVSAKQSFKILHTTNALFRTYPVSMYQMIILSLSLSREGERTSSK
jgi:aspartate/methionine/tyrosine aminotransferase